MKLHQLRYLCAVVQNDLNITAAAQKLHASQPGVSKQIKLLEEDLGFELFVRQGRNLARITPASQKVIDRALRILQETQSIRDLSADAMLVLATSMQPFMRSEIVRAISRLPRLGRSQCVMMGLQFYCGGRRQSAPPLSCLTNKSRGQLRRFRCSAVSHLQEKWYLQGVTTSTVTQILQELTR